MQEKITDLSQQKLESLFRKKKLALEEAHAMEESYEELNLLSNQLKALQDEINRRMIADTQNRKPPDEGYVH